MHKVVSSMKQIKRSLTNMDWVRALRVTQTATSWTKNYRRTRPNSKRKSLLARTVPVATLQSQRPAAWQGLISSVVTRNPKMEVTESRRRRKRHLCTRSRGWRKRLMR